MKLSYHIDICFFLQWNKYMHLPTIMKIHAINEKADERNLGV